MPWRLQDHVTHGEIDNRERNRVRATLWFRGDTKPVVFDLAGNACRDLAGCRLSFKNLRSALLPLPAEINLPRHNNGTIGDLTASRKFLLSEAFPDETDPTSTAPPPPTLANGLYLEWFTRTHGRLLIEGTGFKVEISTPSWSSSPADERVRQALATTAFHQFVARLDEDLKANTYEPPEDHEWDEFDYERFLRESDARTRKYLELLDKFQDHPDADALIEREMNWVEPAVGSAEPDGTPGGDGNTTTSAAAGLAEEDEAEDSIDGGTAEPEPLPDPETEGVDWIRDAEGDIQHPLTHRVIEGAILLDQRLQTLDLDEADEIELTRLADEYKTTGAKLAGALNGLAYGREFCEGPFIVACLKRGLQHLHATQAALETVASRRILLSGITDSLRTELFRIREEILHLMQEFRRKA